MLIGDVEYPIEQAILFFVLVVAIIFNVFLFKRGEGNYSIKYELMRKHQFFRANQCALYTIQYIYKSFFVLPFILIIIISILRGIKDTKSLAPLLINGLIILLILYPTKNLHYNIKNFAVWTLAISSQMVTFFIYLQKNETAYVLLSIIFYVGNIVFFFLSILSIQNDYWQISTAIQKFPQQVRQVNQQWIKDKDHIPQVFDGGLYGYFCKKNSYLIYVILYFISLIFLGLYAFFVWLITDSYLGVVGIITNIIYDIFVTIFNSIKSQGRSLGSIYILIVAGRLLTFIFGSNLWLLGYCLLYFGVAVFIGYLIIDRHLPVHNQQEKKKKQRVNALKTPEFVLFILTLQIIIMIVTEIFALKGGEEETVFDYNQVNIPIWQWGVLALIAAWVIIIYMVSVRILVRTRNRVQIMTQYYFGLQGLTSYHIFIILSYVLLIFLGLYAHLILLDTVILVGCIFLPLIYLCLLTWIVEWQKNEFRILAQTEEYNKQMKKQYDITIKRRQILNKNQKMKQKKKQLMMSKVKRASSIGGVQGIFQFKMNKVQSIQIQQKSGSQLVLKPQNQNQKLNQTNSNKQQIKKQQYIDQIPPFKPLKDWKNPDEQVSCGQIWYYLTPSDKQIIISSILLIILLAGYCVSCMLWAKSQFAISFTVCLISYFSALPFYRSHKNKSQIQIIQLIANWLGVALGFVYWGIFNHEVVGAIGYSLVFLVVDGFLAYKAFKHNLQLKMKLSLCIQMVLHMVFILITLGIQKKEEPIFVVIFSIVFVIILILLAPLYFQAVHQNIPKRVIIIVSVLIGVIVIAVSVVGFVLDALSGFVIFTIIMVLIQISLLSASIGLFAQKYYRRNQAPNIYSAYGYPNYRFESQKQQLKSNMNHMVVFSFSMVALVVYSVIVTIFFQEKQAALYALSLFIVCDVFVILRSSMSTHYSLGTMKQDITDEIILRSLKKLTQCYMIDQTQGQDSPYYKAQKQKARKKAEQTKQAKDFKSLLHFHDLLVKNLQQQQKFLFYWIALIQFNVLAERRQVIITSINQLKQIQQQLQQNGIFLDGMDSALKPQQKYQKLMKQIQTLQPLDHVIYQEILAVHRQNEKQKKSVLQDIHKKQIQKNNQRQQQLFNQMQEAEDPDHQVAKFEKLLKDLGRKTLFTDQDFPANQNSLGQLQSKVYSWRRPNVGQVFSKSGISADDIKQGDIGDCYLVSSFGVLGQKRIKQAIGFDQNGNQRWKNQKGAYMVRFFKFSKQYYITIDDQLPVNSQDQWVFAKSQDPVQFWPAILEKAYAKLYKGYHNIVQGKCHRVLAQFTGGFPFQIILQTYKSNPNGLWSQLINGKNNGYLLAAGSPTHPNGDSAFSKRGIVQGHAYAVLDVKQADDYKLIKLKNPHGSAGKEWIGDFSDKSDLMTKRMMQILNHAQLNDGIFWMTIQDFIYQFKSLYICSVFDDRWKKIGPIHSQFTQQNSMGTPNNQGCQKNPHYGITVTKHSTIFISLTQQSKSALKGKYPIYMRVQRNDGTRMRQQDISSQKTCGKPQRPIDAVTISTQIQLQADNYPYTFSLLLCCKDPGSVGKYSLQIYCNDKQVEIIDDKDFDPINQ